MHKLCWVLPWLLAVILCGQDQTSGQYSASPDQAPPTAQGQPSPPAVSQGEEKTQAPAPSGTSKDRLLFTLPNFLTLENAQAGKIPPLTVKQKFGVTTRSSFDPVEYVWYAGLAGIAQWDDSEPTLGQGAKGYWERYGIRFADGTIENYMTQALLPSILHQDPRYFQLGHGRVMHRIGYALERLVVTRSDSGQTQFNVSEILGGAMAGAISTYSYHPRDERNISNVLSTWGSQMAFDSLGYELKEFWPDLRKWIRKPKPAAGP